MFISTHGGSRTRKRLGITKKSATENINDALKFGITRYESKGNLRRYLDKLYFRKSKGNIWVYNRHIYIFSDNFVLITSFALPNSLVLLADTLQDKKNNKIIGDEKDGV